MIPNVKLSIRPLVANPESENDNMHLFDSTVDGCKGYAAKVIIL
jgi:hypothetical protein